MSGRRANPIDIGECADLSRRAERDNAIRCRRCPKISYSCWCSVLAKTVNPNLPACEFGKKAIHAAYMNEQNRKKKGKVK